MSIKKLDNILIFRLIHPDSKPLDISTPYWNLRDSITTCELMLLRLFNFKVTFDTPHKVNVTFTFKYIASLEL